MRIRKYAKFSLFLHTNSNPTFSSVINQQKTNLICTLNQSPWDIINFPSSHSHHQLDDFEVHYNVNLVANLSSVDSAGHIQSVGSTKKTSQCKHDNVDDLMKDDESYDKEDGLRLMKEDEKIVLSDKTNGKSMCKDVVDVQNGAIGTTKKMARPVSKSTARRSKRQAFAKKPKLCQLNQSPWDIIAFPSSHSSSFHQFDDFEVHYNVNLVANLSSVDFGGPIQSVASTMNLFECKYDDNADVDVNENVDDSMKDYKLYENEDNFGYVKEDEKIVFHHDSRNGTKVMCEDVQNEAIGTSKKKVRPVSMYATRRTTRRVVAKKLDDFYYYSGFGPSWGKKRGGLENKYSTYYSNVCDSIMSSNLDINEEQKGVEFDRTSRAKM